MIAWLQDMLSHDFVRNAFVATAGIALASGLVGYLMVLRNQVFSGDALSHVAFTGTLAAFAAGIAPLAGLFGATVAVALGMALLGGTARSRDVVVGTVFAWVLGLGALFLRIYADRAGSGDSTAGVSVLFGSVYGLSPSRALAALLVGAGVCAVVVAMARPLLFASLDADVAAARGVPVRLLGMVFLALAGVTVAEAVQAVGALLAVGLMVTPAAAVQRFCMRPLAAFGLSALAALACAWLGLSLSYAAQRVPPSVMVVAVAFTLYLCATAAVPLLRRLRPA
jgi:zinc/manganese transport system permease protein